MVNWSGRTSAYPHKHGDWQNADLTGTPEALQTKKILYAQWTLCPVEVEDEIKNLWRMNEFGNDNFYYSTSINDLLEVVEGGATVREVYRDSKGNYQERQVPISLENLIYFARTNGLKEDEQFLIHWWW